MDSVTAGGIGPEQRRNLEARFGSGAREWIAALPATLDHLCAQWDLDIEGFYQPGCDAVVYRCRRGDGSRGALKVSPEGRLIAAEAATLALWASTGRVPEIWGLDVRAGALLTEAIEPGDVLADTEGPPELERIVDLIRGLHNAVMTEAQQAMLKPLSAWAHFIYDYWERRRNEGPAASAVPAAHMHRGYCKARELINTGGATALHGNLHAGTVLEGGMRRGLVAISPQGCWGDPVLEAAQWALWRSESRAEVDRRVAVLADRLDIEEQRLARGCEALAPLMAVASVTYGTVSRAALDTLLGMADAAG